MRHLIAITVFGITATLSACDSSALSDGIDNVFTHETNLDDGQKLNVDNIEATFVDAANELLEPQEGSEGAQGMSGPEGKAGGAEGAQGEHPPHGRNGIFHRGVAVDWMIDFIEGELDSAGVLASIQEKQAEQIVHIEVREAELLDLLESFSEEQAVQFLDNLDQRQAWIEERERDLKQERRPKRGAMFGDLALTEDQQAQLETLLVEMRDDRVRGPEGERDLIESFLSGEITREDMETELSAKREFRFQEGLDRASDWIAFVETLSVEQQGVLLETLEEIQEQKEQHCSNMEDRYGPPPEASEEGEDPQEGGDEVN